MKKILSLLIFVAFSSTVYSQSVADTTDFMRILANNPAEMLRGQISGVRVSEMDGNPLGALNVNIRGVNSIRSDNQPLWIIDGVPVSLDKNHNLDAFWQYGEQSYTAPLNALNILDPSEIESIEVLKNTSATALYGARGANGVVIIKTYNSSEKEREIDLASNVGVNFDNIGSNPVIRHNHRIAFRGQSQKGANGYNISATFREVNSTIGGNNGNNFALKVNYFTTANKVIHFGFDALAGMGNSDCTTATAYLGAPSYTLALRDPALSGGISADDWLADYDDEAKQYTALANAWIKFNITRQLSFKVNGGLDFQNHDRIIWYGKRTDFGAVSADNVGGGAAALLETMMLGYDASAVLDYNTYIADDHRIHAAADFEIYGNTQRFNTLNGRNFAVHTMRGKGISSKGTASQNRLFTPEYFHYGGTLFVEYDWKSVAGADLSFRVDNTPAYKETTLYMYPSFQAYVDFHKLLLPSVKGISTLCLRGGWGVSGREQYVPYEQFGTFLSSGWPVPEPWTEFFYDGLNVLKTSEMNVTADLGFLSDRLRASITYYDRSTDDGFTMYGSAGDPVENKGKVYYHKVKPYVMMERLSIVTNRGFELELDALCLNTSELDWRISAGGAYNVNQVVSVGKGDFSGRAVGRDIFCTCNSIGLPVSSLYGYRSDKDGNYLDVTGEGVVSEADKTILGNAIPKYTAYIGTVLKWKGLMLDVRLDGAAGFQIANINNLVKDGKTDTSGKIALSSRYVEDGDFLRLGVVAVSWSIPNKIKWLSDVTLNLCAKNLLTVSKYSGWNPDVNSFGINALSSGLDYGSYPAQKSVVCGVSLKF